MVRSYSEAVTNCCRFICPDGETFGGSGSILLEQQSLFGDRNLGTSARGYSGERLSKDQNLTGVQGRVD
jgi:hypothetical protein